MSENSEKRVKRLPKFPENYLAQCEYTADNHTQKLINSFLLVCDQDQSTKMSRVIVKNLPKNMTSEKLNGIFAAKGDITDLQLKYTKAGLFRRFAFIGFHSNAAASSAIDFFNNTFIDASRIQVEEAKDLTASEKPRPWSKYSEGSSAFKKKGDVKREDKSKPKKDPGNITKESKKDIAQTSGLDLGELAHDPDFQEFLEVHKVGDKKQTWANDAVIGQKTKGATKGEADSDEEENKSTEGTAKGTAEGTAEGVTEDLEKTDKKQKKKKKKKKKEKEQEDEEEEKDEALAETMEKKSNLSDMEYLRSKMVEKKDKGPSEDHPSPEEKPDGKKSEGSILKEYKTTEKYGRGEHVVRVTGVHRNFTEEDIVTFFSPLKIKVIRSMLNANGRRKGKLYVEFFSEDDVSKAVLKHKEYIGERYVQVTRDRSGQKPADNAPSDTRNEESEKLPWQQQAEELKNSDEQVAETGRIFVRNLAYICTETDVEQLFSTYGPLTEVNLPIDKFTKKTKGFAFVTFMMPEHAVKAYTELDGKNFMGRLMHLLPGKEKIVKEEEENEGSSYKNKKAAKQKSQSGSSHNWNTLFIGSNAVADALAARYNTTKKAVLDPASKGSLGVRLALGETQIVAETRQFLLDNGVALDSFSQPSAPRSKTVMLAKNLPAGTKAEELTELFGEFGQLGKVLLPPAGVTAIVEMLEISEAKVAFYNLAYTKFHHVPLYLEWAPVDVFTGSGSRQSDGKKEEKEEEEEDMEEEEEGQGDSTSEKETKPDEKMEIGDQEDKEEQEEEEDVEETEPESTLFVKNLNFETVEETLKTVFSKCGKVRNVVISRKKDPYHSEELLSMGFGFVEYFKRDDAMKALKKLQHTQVDDHQLELKISNRTTLQKQQLSSRKSVSRKKQTSSKIMVRNIPFEAQVNEIRDLFSTFGEIKYVRLPKKMSGTGSHRGFGFVEFLTKQDAKRAFEALCHSSHLFGRRLVLEWAEEDESVDKLRKRTAEHYSDGVVRKQLKKSKLKEDLGV